MKKILSILLSLMLIMSIGQVAFASDKDPDRIDTMVIVTGYKNEGKDNYEISFTGADSNPKESPKLQNVKISDKGEGKLDFSDLTFPDAGLYIYDVVKTDGSSAGVDYSGPQNLKLHLMVFRTTDENGNESLYVGDARLITEDGKKAEPYKFTYSAGSLAVKKEVTGNLGERDKYFTVKVTFTAPKDKVVSEIITYGNTSIASGWEDSKTVEIELKHGDTITFTNIPYGVTYTVAEDSYASDGYDTTYKLNADTAQRDTVNNEEINSNSASVTITNNRNNESIPALGVYLDNLPYVIILAIAVVGLGVYFARKRKANQK